MAVGFTTTYVISAHHHWCCEFESRSERGVQHYVIKFVSDLRQVGGFLRVLRFPPPIKLTATIYLKHIVGSGVKHHQTKPSLFNVGLLWLSLLIRNLCLWCLKCYDNLMVILNIYIYIIYVYYSISSKNIRNYNKGNYDSGLESDYEIFNCLIF